MISAFLLVGVVFIPIGVVSLFASRDVCAKLYLKTFYFLFLKFLNLNNVAIYQVVEIIDRYDAECIPKNSTDDEVGYIQSSKNKTCKRTLTVCIL